MKRKQLIRVRICSIYVNDEIVVEGFFVLFPVIKDGEKLLLSTEKKEKF